MAENPILSPADIRPSIAVMTVESLLNPGVCRFRNKTWPLQAM
jgi:beta-1,2-mannobiose phosphorylase / 1,2-beta-oligomannan phosphorylase